MGWFDLVKNGISTFTGGNLLFALYIPALIVLFTAGKKMRRLLAWPSLFAFILLCNPLTAKLFLLKETFSNRYARVFWVMIPSVVIAAALLYLLGKIRKTSLRVLVAAGCAALCLLLGIPAFAKDTEHPYVLPENAQFISYEAVFLSELVHSEGIEEPKLLYDGFLLQTVRLYDPSIRSEITRNEQEKLEKEGRVDRATAKDEDRNTIAEVYCLGNEDIPKEDFIRAVLARQVDYIAVRPGTVQDRYLQRCGFSYLGGAGSYIVYRTAGMK